jgi:Fe2+ or Zn2+ uptake regulation protein
MNVAKIRNSQQRDLILSIVRENESHPTADEVYEAARASDPHISRGTVYRNLNLLSEIGDIHKLSMPSGPDHFDHVLDDHYHFLCRKCNKVFDTSLKYKEALNETPDDMPGFKTEWHRLLLVGLCPDCGEKE